MRRGNAALRAWRVALLAISVWALSLSAHAEEPSVEARARESFQRGIEAVQRGELTLAAEQFEAAQSLSPNPIVLYNLGQTYSALGWPVQAERALRLYVENDASAADPKRLKEVEDLIAFNVRRIGTVVLEFAPAAAALEVDGSPLALTSPGRIRLAVGRHVLVATSANYKTRIANVDVVPGREVHARLELEPLPRSEALQSSPATTENRAHDSRSPADRAPPAQRGTSTQRAVGFMLLGGGGVMLGLSAIFGLETLRLKNEANDDNHCDETGCDPEGLSLRDSATRAGNWATGLFIGGAVTAAAGLTLYFLDGHQAAPQKSSFRLTPRIHPTRFAKLDLSLEF